MRRKSTPAPRRAGTKAADPAVGLTSLLDALGDDPSRMVMALELMEQLIRKRDSRRGKRKSAG